MSVNVNIKAAASFPDKPIVIINSNKPGGAIDLMTRKMSLIAKKYDDVTILVENVPGGSGAAAMGYVLNQPADGYTLLATLKSFISTSLLNETGPSIDDFHLIACMVYDWEALITNVNSEVISFDDIVKDAVLKNGNQRWLGPMTGGVDHLMALEVWEQCKFDAKWVPYEGSSVSIASLLGGNGAVYVGNAIDTRGRPDLHIAVVAAPERLVDFPQVPTFRELGYDMTQQMWRGFSVKKGTPDHVVSYLEELLFKISQDEEWKTFIKSGFADPIFLNHGEMESKIKSDKALSKKLLLKANIIVEDEFENVPLPDWLLAVIISSIAIVLTLVYKQKSWQLDSDFFIYLLLISISLFFIIKSFNFSDAGATGDYGPAFLPRVWGGGLFVFTGILLFKQINARTTVDPRKKIQWIVLKVMLLLFVYTAAISFIGFYVSSLMFILGMLRIMKYKKFMYSVLISLASLVIIFLIFEQVLGINLPAGLLY